jgi:tetratricopeptide (TPR) repeat protein
MGDDNRGEKQAGVEVDHPPSHARVMHGIRTGTARLMAVAWAGSLAACGPKTGPPPSAPATAEAKPAPSLEERLAAARTLLTDRDLPAALAAFTEISERARLAGDRRVEAIALRLKGVTRLQQVDPAGAVAEYLKSAEVAEASGHRLELGQALMNAGTAHIDLSEYDRALVVSEKAVKVFEALGDAGRVALVLSNM